MGSPGERHNSMVFSQGVSSSPPVEIPHMRVTVQLLSRSDAAHPVLPDTAPRDAPAWRYPEYSSEEFPVLVSLSGGRRVPEKPDVLRRSGQKAVCGQFADRYSQGSHISVRCALLRRECRRFSKVVQPDNAPGSEKLRQQPFRVLHSLFLRQHAYDHRNDDSDVLQAFPVTVVPVYMIVDSSRMNRSTQHARGFEAVDLELVDEIG